MGGTIIDSSSSSSSTVKGGSMAEWRGTSVQRRIGSKNAASKARLSREREWKIRWIDRRKVRSTLAGYGGKGRVWVSVTVNSNLFPCNWLSTVWGTCIDCVYLLWFEGGRKVGWQNSKTSFDSDPNRRQGSDEDSFSRPQVRQKKTKWPCRTWGMPCHHHHHSPSLVWKPGKDLVRIRGQSTTCMLRACDPVGNHWRPLTTSGSQENWGSERFTIWLRR